MAEACANKYGKDKFIVSSAGNKPADKVNPIVVEALKEKGIDISRALSSFARKTCKNNLLRTKKVDVRYLDKIMLI
jgi:protein-tyrosine-phosphatase